MDDKLLSVFRRVLRCELADANFAAEDVPQWDSLSHIKLVMELESEFGISIGPDDIPALYSDYHTVEQFVVSKIPGS